MSSSSSSTGHNPSFIPLAARKEKEPIGRVAAYRLFGCARVCVSFCFSSEGCISFLSISISIFVTPKCRQYGYNYRLSSLSFTGAIFGCYTSVYFKFRPCVLAAYVVNNVKLNPRYYWSEIKPLTFDSYLRPIGLRFILVD